MNHTVSNRFLAKEEARDPENFRRECLAEFTDVISSFLSADVIQACVVNGRAEMPADLRKHSYVAAVDAAYKGDCFTLCIAHHERSRNVVVIDCLRGWEGTRKSPLRWDACVCQRSVPLLISVVSTKFLGTSLDRSP